MGIVAWRQDVWITVGFKVGSLLWTKPAANPHEEYALFATEVCIAARAWHGIVHSAICLSKRFYFITSFLYLRGFPASPYITSFDASVLSLHPAKITFFVVKSARSFIRMIPMWTAHAVRNVGRKTASLNFNPA